MQGRQSNPLTTFSVRAGRFVMPTMAGLLGLYILMHSPLRTWLAVRMGQAARGCYFICNTTLTLNRFAEVLAAFVLIAVACLAAWAAADSFAGPAYEWPLAFGLGATALLTVPAAAIGEIADWQRLALLHPPLGPLLAMIPAAGIVILAVWSGWRPHAPVRPQGRPGSLILCFAVLAALALVASVAISLMHPANSGDALSYHAPMAVFLWRDGNLGTFLDRAPYTWALAHPGTAEIWFGLLGIAGGESFANLGQLPFAFLGSFAVYAFTRRLGLRQGAGLLASLAFLLTPIVIMQVGTQPNAVFSAALLMAVVALAAAPITCWSSARIALLGLGLGLVTVTKLALLPGVGATILFTVLALVFQVRMRGWPSQAARLALLGLLFLAVVSPWWGRNIRRYQNPIYPQALPLLGRGVFIPNFGRIDREFVPSAKAWPLYLLLEPHDDRSGFGALLAVGATPGLIIASLRGRRQPLLLYGLLVAATLPAWWVFTLHEPRFLLPLAGLSFAFLPWSLLGLPKTQRRLGVGLLAVAAIFSVLVTFDEALLPVARQPNTRPEFYDRVWAVDPAVTSLPDSEGLLFNTGYAADIPEYAAYYPLLGQSLSRLVIPVDVGLNSDETMRRMRSAGIRYAYVTASADQRATVERLYDPVHFELVHVSTVVQGESSGIRQHLYRPPDSIDDNEKGTRRYLYRLR